MHIIFYHPYFLNDWSTLSLRIKKKARRQIILFQEKPNHAALKNHKLSGVMKDLWAFSITLDYRIVYFYDQKGRIVFMHIGRHKDVY